MTESPIGPNLGPLLLGFESLGDSCEFGLVQRAAGIEPLGLLRFSSAPIAPLIEALDSGFSAFRNDPRLELFTTADHEYMVRVQPYGFSYHTGRFTTDVAERVVHAQQARIVPFLVEKLLADLASAEKIFVRKGDGTANHGSIRRLCRSIQRYGPARLLAILPETDLRPSGTIEDMGDGLLTGYIDQFAPYDDAHDFSVVWREICFNARMFLAGASKASSILLSRQPSKVRNFLKIPNLLSARGGRVRFQGEALPAEEIPEIQRSRASTRHRLTTGITSYTVAACSCVSTSIAEPNTLHVASLCVWIPAGSGVNDVCIMLEGSPTLFTQAADMSLRDAWQRISVTSIVPPNQQTVTVSLFISGTSGSDVIASGWVLERGSLPTSLNNRCHDLYADGLLQRKTKKSLPENPHHVISVDDLIGRLTTCGLGRSLGNFRVAEVNEKPLSMDAGGRSPVRLRGVAVHGSSGVITVGSLCLSETLAECSDNGQAGAGSRSPPTDELAVGSVSSAAHFMPLRADCYWDWLVSSISRFETYNAESLASVGQAGSYPLLMRPCDTEWKKDLVSLIIPENIKRVILRPGVHLRVEDLLYAPPPPLSALSKGFLLAAERLKARVYTQLGVPQRRPWRKIFLLPSIDCANRIAYLPDLTAELERQGFEVLQVQALSVAQSIYAFSEASHVVAFSTEMLVNAVFCAPQTIIRELSCRCHSVLSLETIASLRDLDYKCLDKAVSVRFRKPFEI